MMDSARSGPRKFVLDTASALYSDGTKNRSWDIHMNTLVTKVCFVAKGITQQAVGVDFLDGKCLYRADPRSGSASTTGSGSVNVTQVILSAGAINTPQLLKLSGIGGKSEG